MAFIAPTKVSTVPDVPEAQPYDHGYSEEEVHRITLARNEITKRDLSKEPVTLEEFKNVIAPWFRIQRTEEFILHPVKEKVAKEPKAPKVPKEPKPKKLTKKQIQDELTRLMFKMATGGTFSDEEKEFYFNQTGGQL